jgi:hypothetical protein
MNRKRQQDERKRREWRNPVISGSDLNKVLDILLALDRMVVEISMHVYNIPLEQNQRLHDAVREHLPRLLEPSRSHS